MIAEYIGGGSIKKVLCLILAFILICFCAGCTTTIITTIEEYENFFGGSNKKDESENILPSVTITPKTHQPVATTRPRSSSHCFDALDKKQQQVYETISAAAQNVIPGNILLQGSPTKEDVYIAFWAVVRDHPEYFWLADQIGYVKLDGKIYFYLVYCMDTDKISLNKTAFNTKLNDIKDSIRGQTDYQIVLSIHDFLCESVDYNYKQKEYSIYNAWGVLMNGTAVCQGYAETFMLLCNRYGIECVLISGKDSSGEPHMWNQVKMGGKWYNIDVTFDDANNQNFHAYFGLTNSDIKNDHSFSPLLNREHIEDYTNNYFNFSVFDCYSYDLNYFNKSNQVLSEDVTQSQKKIISSVVNSVASSNYTVDFRFDYSATKTAEFMEEKYHINKCISEINRHLKAQKIKAIKLKSYYFVGESVRMVFEKK